VFGFLGWSARKKTMKKEIVLSFSLAVLMLAGGVPAQDQPVKVKGGHEMAESAEQFFAEGQEKEALSVCTAGDFKGLNSSAKRQLRKHCEELADIRRLAMSGKREEYQSGGDPSEMREDTFTFDGGHLVRVELRYSIPSAEFNYRGLSFEKIFAGAEQAYGSPTSESTKPTQDAYGVPYVAHRELWTMPRDVILITEQPGPGGSTSVAAFTRAEYDRTVAAGASKPANPLE
jgi:hypothetical protein